MYRGVLNKAEVAIKVVTSHHADQQSKFVQEIVTLRACHNTYIVQVNHQLRKSQSCKETKQ